MIPLFHFIFFLVFVELAIASSSSINNKPGCPARCGNVSIPYPFGVGPDCFLDESFSISCNTSTIPPKPYLKIEDKTVQVVEISLDNPAQIRIKYPYPLAVTCYDISTENTTWDVWDPIQLSETQYTISQENWLTVIGCDDFAAATTLVNDRPFPDACIGYCSNAVKLVGEGSCPSNGDRNSVGKGCCRIPISKGTNTVYTGLLGMNKNWKRPRAFSCSYAFVKEKGISTEVGYSYNFSVLQRNSTAFLTEKEKQPVVRLDWRIGAQNCSQAPWNSTYYACQDNSDCVNIGSKIKGYLCNCSQGFQGNPYLHTGCIDIDECSQSHSPCSQNSVCHNIVGSYNCMCRSGFTGDGKSSGSGCIPHANMNKNVLIGVGCAIGFLLLLFLWSWFHKVLKKRNRRKRKEVIFKHLLFQHQRNQDIFEKTKLFTAKELEKATDNFNENRICGKGGQGVVYKGMLFDGTIVAIKKLKQVDENQVEQFINEVVILSQINHRNVVKLLGCCLSTETPLLVYEFLPNGTLFDLIHNPSTEFPLTWNMRLEIAADVAGAVAYLHSASSMPIYHRDIKSTNILLNEKNIIKVSDFGTSKFVEVDKTHLTTLVKGTFGYLDPEYFQTGQYTEKSDVYSFGVVLVELLTGQRPISFERSEVQQNLAAFFLESMKEKNPDAIFDRQVSVEGAKEDVIAVASLARRCLNSHGKMRPTMKEVATELESLRMSQIPPTAINHDEIRNCEAKCMMISDTDYTWTIGDCSATTASFDAHPLTSASL